MRFTMKNNNCSDYEIFLFTDSDECLDYWNENNYASNSYSFIVIDRDGMSEATEFLADNFSIGVSKTYSNFIVNFYPNNSLNMDDVKNDIMNFGCFKYSPEPVCEFYKVMCALEAKATKKL
jgi:hypothetical protein